MTHEPDSSSKPARSGRREAAAILAVACAALAAILVIRGAHASSPQMIGFDMTPGASSTSSAGVATCVEVDQGDSFDADVFATNLQSLTSFDFRVDFDANVLSLGSADYNYLIVQNGGSLFGSDPQWEKAGRYDFNAGVPNPGSSGTGTLARLHFTALHQGKTTLSIPGSPPYAPRITGKDGVFIGDSSGDQLWDGGLAAGTVAVGESCSGATPIVTPAPTHVPNPTPTPRGQTPRPTAPGQTPGPGQPTEPGSSPGTGNGPGATDSPSVNGASETPEPQVGNVAPGTSSTAAPGEQGGPSSTESAGGPASVQNDGGGSSTGTILVVIGILGALAVLGGAVLLWLRRASAQDL